MLINYDLFRIMLSNNDTTDPLYTYLLNPGPDIVILDEGHRIKNSESLVSILIHKIKTKLRICLTGYPLQNHLSEFHCMVDFVAPLLLGTEEHFKNKYRHDIERCYADSTESEKMRAAASLYTVQLLASMVTHRRDESILADELPKKTEFNVQFKMTSAQRQLYNWVIRNFQPNDSALTSLLILRSICNHPKIFQEFILRRMASSNVTKQTKKYVKRGVRDEPIDDIIEENEDDVFFNWFAKSASDMRQLHSDLNFEDWECSGKVLFTIDVCRECKAIKEKIVIVSHSIACLDYLQKQLPKADIKICRVDGQTAAGIRQEIIDRFQYNNEVTALLLSAKAAAIGVNIVSANRIILFDQDWNPLYDEQSVGRIYRYGQTKPVYVYRLLIGDSIEERISAQSFHKKSISRRLIDNEAVTTISKSNLRAYFKLAGQDLPSISVERILNRDINNDVLTLNVLKKNEFRITSFNNHELLKGDMNYSIYMTDYVKARAKKEAMEVLKLWKISNSQNRLE
ncbi:P-loop containing nucleoside triphosphate hydrolase protein [Pilobolus umbonatus]|nr:P-loop containing nucleoside triphosphate hydrolase protein [Pilobolus umbonatus]